MEKKTMGKSPSKPTKVRTILDMFANQRAKQEKSLVKCPVCEKIVSRQSINLHLDDCLNSSESKDKFPSSYQKSKNNLTPSAKQLACNLKIKNEHVSSKLNESSCDSLPSGSKMLEDASACSDENYCEYLGARFVKSTLDNCTPKRKNALTNNICANHEMRTDNYLSPVDINGVKNIESHTEETRKVKSADLKRKQPNKFNKPSTTSKLEGSKRHCSVNGSKSVTKKSKRVLRFEDDDVEDESLPARWYEHPANKTQQADKNYTLNLLNKNKMPVYLSNNNTLHIFENSDIQENYFYNNNDSANNSQEDYQKSYYLENFLLIIKSVLDDPDDFSLFSDEDLEIVTKFFRLSEKSQKFFVRMFQRKFEWHKLGTIKYEEIDSDLKPVAAELCRSNFFISEYELCDLKVALNILKTQSLKAIGKKHLKINGSMKKEIWIEKILKNLRTQPSVSDSTDLTNIILDDLKTDLGPCIKLNDLHRQLFNRVIRLYFLTDVQLEDDEAISPLKKIVMVNMKRLDYPTYQVHRQRQIFRKRDDLIQYEKACDVYCDINSALENKLFFEALRLCDIALEEYTSILNDDLIIEHTSNLPSYLRCFTAGSVYNKCLTNRVDALQKLKKYELAVAQLEQLLNQNLYNQNYRGHWYDRAALNLEKHLKKPKNALQVIEKALLDSKVRTGHQLSLYLRAKKLCKTENLQFFMENIPVIEFEPSPEVFISGQRLSTKNPIPGYKSAFLCIQTGVICDVEEFALQDYKLKGYSEGIHGEGSTIVSLFGVFFWNIIFMDIPDAFRTVYQGFPLDLMSDEFYSRRKDVIENRLLEISQLTDDQLTQEIADVWRNHHDQTCLINWKLFENETTMQSLVSCIGSICLAKLCRRLAEDFKNTHSGVPDLVIWNPLIKTWKMVEVKGPNDHLSDKQRVWLHYLKCIGVSAEVCYVKDVSPKMLPKKKPLEEKKTGDT